ncbi:MAG: hypothetical protein RMY62_011385 [Nostoc sp. ZfuVER08]|jgi:hypothetical protein|uniref:Uncharacterized protein n=1 Tax=Nostoc punctiforme FACHB-252 TaxID=1357509 RepID=A0ABR8HEI1_NOSPU|nr:hypothetical protein [Nostoc punctiforme]MBD2614124.1 hypothetical protein [Nostoc punctiforme FACHB-252]MBL1197642.1 hypothetical protein [Nostoc sp. GBBB01]MDZ8015390.1 hypothetical protein [Nostoc sp. ZfuVER08]
MKAKFLNFLTVCVVTLAVLSPELVVFGIIWERHIELLESQNKTCEVSKTGVASQTKNIPLPQTKIHTSEPNLVNKMLTVTEQYKLGTILQWFFVLTPICVGLAIIFYDRYLVYRAAVLKEQVEMLERLWQQSIEQ